MLRPLKPFVDCRREAWVVGKTGRKKLPGLDHVEQYESMFGFPDVLGKVVRHAIVTRKRFE